MSLRLLQSTGWRAKLFAQAYVYASTRQQRNKINTEPSALHKSLKTSCSEMQPDACFKRLSSAME